MTGVKYEFQPHKTDKLTVDCWFELDGKGETFEFTHRQSTDLSAPKIASYVLTKVMDYARDYALI